MAVTAAELNVRITTAGAAQAKADIAGVGDAVNGTRTATAGAGLAMAGVGAGLLEFTKSMTEAGATYQQEMEFVNALAGGTAQTSQMLQDEALKLDRTTVFSAQDIAAGMEQLAREGFTPLQIAGTNAMNSLIQNASNMAAALKISMPDAANMLGMTMRAFNIDVSQTAQTTDILTEAALRSGKSAAEFNTQLGYVEATAHQLNIPLTDISAAVGELMSQNITGAGQGLRAFLVGITSEGSTAQKEMAKLGISAFDAQGNFIGLGPVIDEVNQALKGLTPEEQSAAIKALSGGNKQVTQLIQLLRDGSTGLTDFEGKMGTLGGAAHVMSTLMDNAAGSFKAFASSLETAKILMGEQIAPLLKPVTDGLRGILGAFIQAPDAVHAFAAAAIAVTGALFALTGAVAIFNALDMGTVFAGMFGGLLSIAPLLLALVAAGALLYEAWTHDFLGIRELVFGLISDAGKFADAFKKAFSVDFLRTDPISATLQAISSGFAALNLQGISQWFDRLSVSSHAVWLQLSALAQQVMPSLNAAWREFGLANDHLVTAMQDLLAGNVPGALRQWRAALIEVGFAWDDVATAISTVAVATIGIGATIANWTLHVAAPAVVDFLGDVGTWIEDHIGSAVATATSWIMNVVMPAAINGLESAGAWISEHFGNVVATLLSWTLTVVVPNAINGLESAGAWISEHFGTVAAHLLSWTLDVAIPDAINGLQDAGSWIETKLLGVTASLTKWALNVVVAPTISGLASVGNAIGDQLISLDWSSILSGAGTTIGNGLATALETAIPDVLNTLSTFMENVDYLQIGRAIGTGIGKFFIGGTGFELQIIAALAHADWASIGTAVVRFIFDAIQTAINAPTLVMVGIIEGLVTALKPVGAAMANAIGDAFKSAWTAFTGWFTGQVNAFIQIINSAIGEMNKALGAVGAPQIPLIGYIGLLGQLSEAWKNAATSATGAALALAGAPSTAAGSGQSGTGSGSMAPPPAPKPGQPGTYLAPAVIGAFPGGISPAPPVNTAPVPTPAGPAAPSPAAWMPTVQQIANANEQAAQYKNTLGGVSAATSAVWKIGSTVWQPTAQQVANAKEQIGQYGNALNAVSVGTLGLSQKSAQASQSNAALAQSMSNSNQVSTRMLEMLHVIPTELGITSVSAVQAASGFTSMSGRIATAVAGIGSFASRAVASAASTAGLSAAANAAGVAIGAFASRAATSAASTAVFAAQLAGVRAQVTSFAAGLAAGMTQAIASVANAGASIRAAAELIGLSLGAAGTSGGLQFANGIGLGALQAAADMAGAGAAIEGIAASISGALAAAGAVAGASFAAGIAAGMAIAAGAASAGVGAIIAICSGVDLFGPGFATGASFGAGVAAGLASEEGAVAAEAAAIVASAAAASAAAAQIASPSKLFRDKIGVPIAQGVAVGIRSGVGLVRDAAGSLISLPTLPTAYSASGAFSGAPGGITLNGGIHVHVDGSQITDVHELGAVVAEKLGPVLVHVADQIRRGQGVR